MDTNKIRKIITGIVVVTAIADATTKALSAAVALRERHEKIVQMDNEFDKFLRSLEAKFDMRFPKQE